LGRNPVKNSEFGKDLFRLHFGLLLVTS